MQLTIIGILALFRSGYDTADIAAEFDVPEFVIYNALATRMRWPQRIRKPSEGLEPGAARQA